MAELRDEMETLARHLAEEIMQAIERAWTAETIAAYQPDVYAWDFEGCVTVYATAEASRADMLKLVRELRGGRDFDPTKPADHYLRLQTVTAPDKAGQPYTTWGVTSAFRAPEGYAE